MIGQRVERRGGNKAAGTGEVGTESSWYVHSNV